MSVDKGTDKVLLIAIHKVLKALAKIGIRYGLSAGAVTELVRRAYVEAAEEALEEQGSKPLMSRVSALTGLYRKEIVRVRELPPIANIEFEDRHNRSTRIVSGWLRDQDFCTRSGRPAVLKLDASSPHSFNELVRRYSGDMTSKSMLDELIRLKIVEQTRGKSVKLIERGYIPSKDERTIFQVLGNDTTDLINTIGANIEMPKGQKRFQRSVTYLHIPQKHISAFETYANNEGQKLLEKLDRWLAKRDTENISLGTPGARIGLGIYQFTTKKPLPDTGTRTNEK